MNNKIGLGIVAILLALKMFVVPWFEWVSESSSIISQQDKTLRKLSTLESQRDSTATRLKTLTQQLSPLQKQLLSDKETEVTTKVFDYLKRQAKQTDVKLTGMKLGDKQEHSVSYYPVRFLLSGDVNGINQFYSSFESAPFKMIVAEARLISQGSAQKGLRSQLTVYIPVSQRKESL